MSKRPGQDPQRRPTIGTTRNPPHAGPAEQVDVIVVKFVSPQDWQFVSSSKQKCSEARGRRRRGTGEGHRQAVAPGSLLAAFSHPRMSLENRYRICGSPFFEY